MWRRLCLPCWPCLLSVVPPVAAGSECPTGVRWPAKWQVVGWFANPVVFEPAGRTHPALERDLLVAWGGEDAVARDPARLVREPGSDPGAAPGMTPPRVLGTVPADRRGVVELANAFPDSLYRIGYLWSEVEAAAPTEVEIEFRAGEGGALWVGGERVGASVRNRPVRATVRLSAARTPLLVKLGRHDGGWSFRLESTASAEQRAAARAAADREIDARIAAVRQAPLSVRVVDAAGKPVEGARVTIRMQRHEFGWGAALNAFAWRDPAPAEGSPAAVARAHYLRLAEELFNCAVHENELKWYHVQPAADSPENFADAERMLAWCEERGIAMRGHCLFWDKPRWGLGRQWRIADFHDKEALRRRVEARARDLPARYRGRIDEWDVNNEMLHGRFFRDELGEDIALRMFALAREGNPAAALYVNDYFVLAPDGAERFARQVETLLAGGAPVGGIGLQAHFTGAPPEDEAMEMALERLASFGLPLKITEASFDEAEDARQVEHLRRSLRRWFSHPAVDAILLWGFFEGVHWMPHAHLWRRDGSPRPAGAAFRDLVFREWWTDAAAETDGNGRAVMPAFFGTHEVTATAPDGRASRATVHLSRRDPSSHTVELTVL